MKNPERTIQILGVVLLLGFTTSVAALYWDLPARMRSSSSGESPAQKPSGTPLSLPATPVGQCPVYRGQGDTATLTTGAQTEAGGGCCAQKSAAVAHECGMESGACEHGKVTGDSPAPSARASTAPAQPANQPKKEPHAH